MTEDGSIGQQYKIENTKDLREDVRSRYPGIRPEKTIEVSTSGKYAARKLGDMDFSVPLAYPVKLPVILKTSMKNNKEDS